MPDKLPNEVRARLERDDINESALEQLIERSPTPEHRHYLRMLISSEEAMWGISVEPGTPESYLIDAAFERSPHYTKLNKDDPKKQE